MTNSISDKSIFQGTKKSNWQDAVEDFKRREQAYESTLELKAVDDRHLLFAQHKYKQNVQILEILAFLESKGINGWVGYAEGCVEKAYLDQLKALKTKIEGATELPLAGTVEYIQFVAEGLGVGPQAKTQHVAEEPVVTDSEPEASQAITVEPVVGAPATAHALSSYTLQALDGLEKAKAEYKKQQEYKDAGIMMTSERYDVKIKNCNEIQTVLHELSDLGVEGWIGYVEGREEQPYLYELRQLKKKIQGGAVIPPAGTDEYMQFVGAAMGRHDIPSAKDYPADHSLELFQNLGLDKDQDALPLTRHLDDDDAQPQEKKDDIIICWGTVSRTVCNKVKTFALSSVKNAYANRTEIALGAVTGCLTKAALLATFGVVAGGITLPVLAIAGTAGACSGTIRAAYRNQKRVNAFNASETSDAAMVRESLGAAALKGAVAGVVGGYLGAQFFDAISHTSFGHWLRDLFVTKAPAVPSKITGAVTRPAFNSTVPSVNATTMNATVASAPVALPQTPLIGADSLKGVLTQDQMAKLPKRIAKLAASGKPEDMLRFYKEASDHYLNKVGGTSMRKVGAALIERGVQLAEQANITNGTAQKLFADYSFVKAWGRGLVADRAVALDYAKRAGDAVNHFGSRLLKLFGTAAQATTSGEAVSPLAPKAVSLPKVAAPRLAA